MKSYWKSILVIVFSFSTLLAQAQEICDNGTDDDGDGLIDCFDGDCATDGACDDFFFGNQVICADDIDVTTFAIRQQWGSADETATSHTTPAIGDLDGNGIPEVISVNNYGTLDLFVLNGATGETMASADIGFTPENAPVIAEIDGDEIGDIIVSQNKGDDLALYNFDPATGTLTRRWRERASVNQPIGVPGVADFDEDGDVEIYYRNEVMDALTGTVIIAGDGNWEQDYVHGSIAVDILPDAACADCAGLELISGNEIWAINEAAGTRTLVEDMDDDIHTDIDPNLNYYPKYYPNWDDQWSSVSVADYNLDGNIDVIMSGALGTSSETYNGETTIFFWDVANSNVITYHDPTNDFVRGPGRVNIGDVDGDGQLNANFVMNQKLYSLDENFNIHWIHPIKEGSSGFTGCSLFDFDGDGAVEVVYRSEESLLIVDGVGNGDNTTSERREIACVSRTQEEYPVIADVDGDGSSEICVSCYFNNATPFSPYSNTRFSHIRVYESDGEAWMPARGVWNQHGYYNVNINDDLTIPTEVQDHSVIFSDGECTFSDGSLIPFPSRPLNTFINQAPILNEDGCVEFASPDIDFVGILSATDAACPDAEITVDFEITNIGDIDISGALPVSYYAGDPRTTNSTLLDTEVTLLVGFEVNETLTISQTIQGVGGDFELFVVINDNGGTPPLTVPLPTSTIPECETGNNIQSTIVGFQRFELQSEKLNDNRKCDPSLPDNGSARAYYFGPTPGNNETFWVENFEDRSNGETSDTDETAWTSDGGTQTPDFFGVSTYNGSQMFSTTRTGTANDVGVVTWTSETIDVSDYTDINISMDLFETGGHESSGQWRDFIRVSYEFRDGNNAVSETGFLSNGVHFGNFTYERAFIANLNSDGVDSLLTITVEMHNTSSSETHYIDNISIDGTGPDIIREFTEPDGFVFNWYLPGDTTNSIYSGSTFPQMAEGTYIVEGFFGATQCFSELDTVVINLDNTPSFNVEIYELSPLTTCASPDGSLAAFAYTTVDGGGIPQDTLTTADGYAFTWFIQTEGVTPIGTGDVINNLDGIGYTVEVIEDLTGCSVSESRTVSSSVSNPPDPTVVITHITTCGGTGQLSANVAGNTADYTFEWYDGPTIKPAVDFTGAVYTVPDQGEYTVVATLNSSSCPSNAVTVTLNDNSIAPAPTTTLVQDNTSCVAGNGIVSADGDGAGTVAGFTFEWFLGANTLAANALPGTAAPGAFLVSDNPYELGGLEEGTYTVRVTEDATSCFETRTVNVTDTPGSLVVTAANLIQNNINSCDPSVLGSLDASGVVPGDVNNASIGNINSDFEVPDITQPPYNTNNFTFLDQTEVPGWSTTAGDGVMELWRDGFNGVPAYSGDQFAEILANSIGALYFDLSTVPSSLLNWTFAHRGRGGTDNIRVSIGAVGSEVGQGDFATDNTDWALYTGNYTVPADQFITRFQFESLDAGSVGNFVDSVTFVLFPYRFELFNGTVATGTPDSVNTSGLFTELADGDYVLVVYDNLTGCGAVEIPITITRSQDQPVIATTITDDANCDTDAGVIAVTASMPTSEPASYTYELFDGHSFTTSLGTENIVDGSVAFNFNLANGYNIDPGDYRVRVTNNDTQCTDFVDVIVDDVTVIPAFTASQTINDNSSCDPLNPNGFLSVSIQGDVVGNYSFTWYDGANSSAPILAGPTVGDNDLGGLDAGDYTVVAENVATGCETVELTLNVADDPYIPNIVITETAPQTDCGTGNGVLTAYIDNDPDLPPGTQTTAGFTFQWRLDGVDLVDGVAAANGSVPSGSQTAVVSGLIADEYTLVVTHDNTDCPATENFVLTENQVIPSITLNGAPTDNTSCNPANYDGAASVNVAPAGTYDFDWFYSNGTQVTDVAPASGSNTANLSGVVNDTYKVVATSTLGCTSDTLVVVIGFDPTTPDFSPAALNAGTENNTVCDNVIAGGFDGQITVNPNTGVVADFGYTWFDGSGTGSPTAFTVNDNVLSEIPGGTYTVVIQNNTTLCDTTIQVSIIDELTDPTFTNGFATDIVTTDVQTCAGAAAYPDGTIAIDTTNIDGSGNYTFEFYFGGSATPANLLAVNNSATIFAQKSIADPGANVNVDFNYTGNVATVSGLNEGDYTVVVTDTDTGCESTPATVTIDATPSTPDFSPAALNAGTENNTVCDDAIAGNFDGQITVNPNVGAVADFSYTWFDGSGTGTPTVYNDVDNVLSQIPGGTYTVVIQNNTTLCDTTIQVSIIDELTDPTFTNGFATDIVTTDVQTCAGAAAYPDGTITIDTTNIDGSGNYTFEFYFGGSATPANLLAVNNSATIFAQKSIADPGANVNVDFNYTGNVATVSGLNEGDYTVVVTDTDTGCESTPATVTIDATPSTPDFSPAALNAGTENNTVCDDAIAGNFDGQITVNPNVGAVADFSYTWFDGSGTGTPTVYNDVDNVLSQIPGGTYTVVIQNNTTLCDTTIQVSIIDELTDPTFTNGFATDIVTTDVQTCAGAAAYPDGTIAIDTTNIDGSGNYTFEFYFGGSATPANLLAVNNSATIFAQKSIADPGANVNVDFNYTGNVATVSGLNEGDYTVVVTDTDTGCESTPATVTIDATPSTPDFSPAALNAGTENNTVCDDAIAGNFDGQITVNPNVGAVADFSYTWFDGSGTGTPTVYNDVDNVLSQIPGGTYTVVIQNNTTLCDTTIQVSIIDELTDPTFTNGFATDIVTGDVQSCAGAATYPDGTIAIDTTNIDGSGNYTFEFYFGGSATPANLLDVSNTDNIFTQKSIADPGANVNVDFNYTGNVATVSGLNEGDYTVVVTDTDTGCESAPATVTIGVTPIAITISSSTINHLTNCVGGAIDPNGQIQVTPLMASGGEPAGGYDFQWYFGSGTGNVLDGTADLTDADALAGTTATGATSSTVSGLEAGTYTVEVTNTATLCTETFEFEVEDRTVIPTIGAGFIATSDNINCTGTPTGTINATGAVTPAAGAGITYTYELLDATNTVIATENTGGADDGIFEDLAAGNYTVRATINETGCVSTEVPAVVGETLTLPDLSITKDSDETSCASPNGGIDFATADATPADNWDVGVYRGIGTAGQNVFLATNSALSAWSTPDTLSAGTYSVQIVNRTTGCDSVNQISILEMFDEPALDAADVTKTDDRFCTSDNGTITITADDSNIPNNAGADPIFNLYTGSVVTGAPTSTAQPSANNHTFTGLAAGTYTVTIQKDESGCESNGITITIIEDPITFTPTITLVNNQTSCDIADPNGQLSVAVTVGASTDIADYTVEWFLGANTNLANRINDAALTGAVLSGTSNSIVSGLPAGTYTVKVTDPTSGCFYTEEQAIIDDSENPTFILGAVNSSNSCTNPTGQINFTIDASVDGATDALDGAAGYTVELYDGPTIGATESPIATITAANLVADSFDNLLEGTYSIRAIDNNTSCEVEQLNISVGYNGDALAYDPDNIFKDPLSACFTNDGILDFVDAVTSATNITGNVTIHWYIGTDTLNKANLVRNALPGVTFSSSVFGGAGGPVTIDSSRMENLPAISYTGVIEYANGCVEVFNTSLSTTDAPTLVINAINHPTRCATDFDGSFDIQITTTGGDSPDEFNYWVFEGDQTIAPDTDGTNPFDPNLSTYAPLLLQGTFTSAVANDTESITVNSLNVTNGLDSGTYTVAIEINDADRCITNVTTVTLNAPPESSVTLDAANTTDNTICDVTGALSYNGQIQVDASNPAGGTFDFTWYFDGDNDGDFSDGGADGQQLISNGANGAGTGSNVTGATTTNANTATITGLGAGWYRVIAIHDNNGNVAPATQCPDTLDIQLFDNPLIINFDNAPANLTQTNILDCTGGTNEFGVFQFTNVVEDGVALGAAAADGNFTINWEYDANQDGTFEVSPFNPDNDQNDATNLTAGDYRLEIISEVTGCTTDYTFTIDDDTENPIIELVAAGTADNTICDGPLNDPNGSIDVRIVDSGGNPLADAGYNFEWFFGTGTGNPLDATDLSDGDALAGTATSNVTGLEGGTYTVRVTDNGTPNEQCISIATFNIVDDFGEVTINTVLTTDIDIEHQENCTGFFDGRYEVLQVYQDGVGSAVGGYTFEWFESDQATALGTTTLSATFPQGATGPEAATLPAGTYYVRATNTSTDCVSAIIEFVINDNSVDPNVQISLDNVDESCDDDVAAGTRSGTGDITATVPGFTTADYTFTWYEGTSAAAGFDLAGPGASVVATGFTIGGTNGSVVTDLPDGTYYVEVTDNTDPGRGCIGSETITITQFSPVLTLGAEGVDFTVQDDMNCVGDNGSITIIAVNETQPGGGSIRNTTTTDYTFTWFDAPTGGTNLGTGNPFDDGGAGLGAGTYYVEITRNSSECVSSTREAIVVEEVTIDPVINLNTSSDDTFCDGTNNVGDGSLAIAITEDGGAAITLADYSIEWYRGSFTVSPTTASANFLHDDAGSASGANVGSAAVGGDIRTLTGLETGTYTVFITKDNGDASGNGNEGCSTFATFNVGVDQPTLTVSLTTGVTVVDNDNCSPANGSILIDEIIIDGVPTPLVDASPYTINWTATGGGAVGTSNAGVSIANDQLTGVDAGTYTFNITHNTTGCTTGSIDVVVDDTQVDPVINAAATDDTFCDGTNNVGDGSLAITITEDGGAAITLADYSIEWYRGSFTVSPTTASANFLHDDAGSASGANVGSAAVGGDIRTLTGLETGTYTVFITKDNGDASGNGNEGCSTFATFNVGVDQPTLTVSLTTGVTVVDNDNCSPANGSILIDEIIIDGVPTPLVDASPYTINWTATGGGAVGTSNAGVSIANDQLTGVDAGTYTFNITHNTTGCTTGSIDVVVDDIQVDPVINAAATDDTFCDGTNNVGDGSLAITITEDGGAAITLADYSIEWYRGSFTVSPTTASANFLHDDAGSASGANVGSAAVGGDIRTLTGLETGTYTVFITKDNGDASGNGNEGCSTFATFNVGVDQPTLTVSLTTGVTVVDNDNCSPANGSILIDEIIIDGVPTPLVDASPYTINWTATGGGAVGTSNAGVSIANDQLTGVDAGTYTFNITHNTTGCTTGSIDVVVDDTQVDPVINAAATDDTFCDGTNNVGDGSLAITITEDGGAAITLADYSIEWYRGSFTVSPTTASANFLHDDAGSASGANVGSAAVGGDIRTLTGLETGTYTVFITKDNGDASGNGNEGCSTFATFNVGVDQPTLTVSLTTGVTVVDNDNCSPANGSILIDEIIIDGVPTPLVDASPYTINWTATGGGTVGTSNAGVSIANDQLTGVDAGTYTFNITHNTTGCTTGSIDVVVDDIQVDPVINLTASTEDTFCDNTGDRGDGSLTIDITEDDGAAITLADYSIEWYRGSFTVSPTTASANFLHDDAGSASGANVGTAAVGGDIRTLTGLATGTYTVFITKDNGDASGNGNEGCTASAIFDVGSMQDIPTLDDVAIQASTSPDTLCTGTSGTLTINDADVSTGDLTDFEIRVFTGAVGVGELAGSPFTNPAATSISYTTLAASNYFITAQNTTTGCFAATAIVNVGDSIRNPQVALVSMTPDEDCGGGVNAGALEILIDGQFDHTAHFDVQWFTGAGAVGGNEIVGENAVTLTGFAAGTYSVSVRNQNTDCSISRDFEITNVPIFPSISDFSVSNNTICDDDNDNNPVDVGTFELLETTFDGNTFNQAAMTGNYQLEVFTLPALTPVVDNDGATPFLFEELSAGNYRAIVTKIDSDCPSNGLDFEIIDIVERPTISIALQVADSICTFTAGLAPTGSLRATANQGATTGIDDTDPDYNFSWYFGSGTASPMANGVDPGNGSNPAGVTTSTVSGLIAGTYTVQVERVSTGCITTEEFILPNAPTNVEILTVDVVDATNCVPGNGSITVTSVSRDNIVDYNFEYYDIDPSVGSPAPVFTGNAGAAYTTAVAGTYYIIGTNTLVNCTTPIFQVEVEADLTFPVVALAPEPDGFDRQTNCDTNNPNGRLRVLADGQPENATYDFEWYFGTDTSNPLTSDDYPGGANLMGANTNEVSGLAAGFYTVEVTNTITGCTTIYTEEMTDAIPEFTLSPSSEPNRFCINPNGTISVNVVQNITPRRPLTDWDYYWFIGDLATIGTNPNPADADFTGSRVEGVSGGTYVVLALDNVDPACDALVDEVVVEDATTPPPFELTTSGVTVCFDEKDGFAQITIDDVSSVDIEWYDDARNLLDTTLFLGSLDAGMYTVELTNTTTGCVASEVFEIENNAVIPNAPFVIVNNGRTNCTTANGSAIANVDGETNNFLFEWFDPSDMINPYATGSEVFNLDSITYLVKATNITTGCESALTPVEIEYDITIPEFEVVFNNSVCLRTEDGSTNQFTGTAIVSFAEFNLATDYRWVFNETGEVVGDDSRLIDAFPGDYTVFFTAENGCEYEASFTIETSLTIYNGVSANADGKNDFFLIDCIDYFPNNNVKIFNRAGQRLYEIDGYNNTSVRFEGFSNVGGGGLKLPAGTYFYVIDLGTGESPVQGFLELVR